MTILKLHSEPLQEAWLDPYGHLNEGYYLVPFGNAQWPLCDHFGVGVEYFKRTGGALYSVETHLRYLREVRAPATLEIECMIFGSDARRMHVGHVMKVDGTERATFECVMLHFDTRANKTTAMPDEVQAKLKRLQVAEIPNWSGRSVSLTKK